VEVDAILAASPGPDFAKGAGYYLLGFLCVGGILIVGVLCLINWSIRIVLRRNRVVEDDENKKQFER